MVSSTSSRGNKEGQVPFQQSKRIDVYSVIIQAVSSTEQPRVTHDFLICSHLESTITAGCGDCFHQAGYTIHPVFLFFGALVKRP